MNLSKPKIFSQLWFKTAVVASAAVGAVALAPLAKHVLPPSLASGPDSAALDKLLDVLSSNMLTVVTFSLSTMVAAIALIVTSAPPRATALIVRDSRAHRALATFMGAFVFGIAATYARSNLPANDVSSMFLTWVTLAVLGTVLWTMIRWIDQLSGMGHLNNVLDRVEKVAESAFERCGFLIGDTEPTSIGQDFPIVSKQTGFVQRIDYTRLSAIASGAGCIVTLAVAPGDFIMVGKSLAWSSAVRADERFFTKLRGAIIIGSRREMNGDPRFACLVLAEIGSRALSPGINDPGTAIQTLATLFRLLAALPKLPIAGNAKAELSNLRVKKFSTLDLFDDAFRSIARDGASAVEVQVFLRKGLRDLAEWPAYRTAALHSMRQSRIRLADKMSHTDDLNRVDSIVEPTT